MINARTNDAAKRGAAMALRIVATGNAALIARTAAGQQGILDQHAATATPAPRAAIDCAYARAFLSTVEAAAQPVGTEA